MWHDCTSGFGEMLRLCLSGSAVIAALGPIYETDPASDLLFPFRRSAGESGWKISEERDLAPDHIIQEAMRLRSELACTRLSSMADRHEDLVRWSRAGLVLEIARRRGINVRGLGTLHPNWKLKGTVTERFGCDPLRLGSMTFNPLSLGPEQRGLIVPSTLSVDREVCVLDFKGMDMCSMISVIPGLGELFVGSEDHHQRTADLAGLSRDEAKQAFLSWAYGSSLPGSPEVSKRLSDRFPMVKRFTGGLAFGEFPRIVQRTSSRAFRAALSEALPLLLSESLVPMFTVHDELVVDRDRSSPLEELVSALESGATRAIGSRYVIRCQSGDTYATAKGQ